MENNKAPEYSQPVRSVFEIEEIFNDVANYEFQVRMQMRTLEEKELADARGKISSFTGPELAQLDDFKIQEIETLRTRINSL